MKLISAICGLIACMFLLSLMGVASPFGAFPVEIDVTCSTSDTEGKLWYHLTNVADTEINLNLASHHDVHETTYLKTIFNGREIYAKNCGNNIIESGETVKCTLDFDPHVRKSGNYRLFHKQEVTNYQGQKIQDVLHFRAMVDGLKQRKSVRFDCPKIN